MSTARDIPPPLDVCDGARGVSQTLCKEGHWFSLLPSSHVPTVVLQPIPSPTLPELVPTPHRAPSIPAFMKTKTRAEVGMGEAETRQISQSPPAGRVPQLRNLSQDKRRLGRGGPGAETLPTLPVEAARAPWGHHLPISGFHHHQAPPVPPGQLCLSQVPPALEQGRRGK